MPNKFSTGTCSIAALVFGLVVYAVPAYAGFEWVAPSQEGQQPMSYGAPGAATSRPEVISPVVISGDEAPPIQMVPTTSYGTPTFMPDVGTQREAPSPVLQPTAPMQQQAEPASMSNATLNIPASSGGDIVQGFASQVPLALALRQILPIGFNFSIDQNIDMDTLVSYKGGKSWRETLKEMLVPPNLVAREQGATLTVSRADSVAPATPILTSTTPPPLLLPASQKYSQQPIVIDSGVQPLSNSSSSGHPLGVSSSSRMNDLPSVNVGSPDGWTAERGDTLRKVLADWCHRSGVELQWLAEYDYPVEASAHFSGGFEDAVRLLLAGFENARPQPIAELHTNSSAGQMLLVVQTRGNNYSN
jgi:hypothetical protein